MSQQLKHSPRERGLHKRDWDSREGEKWKLLPYLWARKQVPKILLNLKERPEPYANEIIST